MQITRNSLDTNQGPADWFTGTVYIDTIATPTEPSLAAPLPGSYAALGASETYGVGAAPHTRGYAYQIAHALRAQQFVDVVLAANHPFYSAMLNVELHSNFSEVAGWIGTPSSTLRFRSR